MERKRKYNLIENSHKLNIFNYLILEQSELFNIDIGENFFYDYEEINKLQETQEQSDFLKILNFNKKKIHSLLLEENEIININDKKFESEKIFPYIYLCILIEDNLEVVNYEYDFELINKLNTEQTKEKNKLKKIIISKLINVLINNFNDEDNNDTMDKMNKIKDYNEKIIMDNIVTLKEYNLNEKDIEQKKIEEIYLEIIKSLIKKQKLEEKIILELEFESISFNNIINELNKIIDKKEEYIKKYEISEFNDLSSDEKITFSYILIKYIFKHPFFIYQNTFLDETRKTIVNLINKNIDSLYTLIIGIKDGNLKDKVEYVLESFFEYRHYYDKSKSKNIKDNDKSHSNPTVKNPTSNPDVKEAQSQSNKSYGKSFDEDLRLDEKDLAYKVLIKSTFKFHIEGKGQEAEIKSDEIEIWDNSDKINIDKIKGYRPINTKLKDKYNKFLNRLKEMGDIMKDNIKNIDNLKIILEFSCKDSKISEKDIDKIEIKCKCNTENPQSSEPFVDKNILGEKWNQDGLVFFIDDINER